MKKLNIYVNNKLTSVADSLTTAPNHTVTWRNSHSS